MSDATGTSSTPEPATAAAPVSPEPSKTDTTATAQPTETKAVEKPAEAKPAEAKPAEAKADAKDAPLYTLPEDFKLGDEASAKFSSFLTGKLVDGKLALSPQDVVDHFVAQARDAFTLWQNQQVAQSKAWEAECKRRYTAEQLASAETGVGFLSNFEPAFRDLAKAQNNNPVFVNAMRFVGELLSEDTFEVAQRAQPAKRSPKDVMYPKRN